MTTRTSLSALFAGTALVLSLACGGGGGGGDTPPPAPTNATSLAYTDPTSGTYQVKKNTGLSTSTHLVLDVVGSGAPNGAGLAFTVTADATRLTWAKVAVADPQYIQNGTVLNVGTGPAALTGKVSGATLTGGLGQKGLGASVALNGVVARFAVDLKSGAAKGTASLAQTKAQLLKADGTMDTTITLTFGTVSAN